VFSVSFATLMTVLAYSRAGMALSNEIRRNLETQAQAVMQQVDAMLFERIKDMQGWRRLDLMQEIRVGDVDKRLARFLHDVELTYAGVYTELYCVQNGHVVAASDAALIDREVSLPEPWVAIDLEGGAISITRPRSQGAHTEMLLLATLSDTFSAQPLGTLAAALDWREVTRLLDQAVSGSGREALLLDADGHPLAVSQGLAGEVASGRLEHVDWHLAPVAHGVVTIEGQVLASDQILLGYAHSTAYKGLPDFGWTLIVLTPEDTAFAAVSELLWTLIVLLAATVAVAVVLAVFISARGARPLQALTRYTREISRELERGVAVPPQLIAGTTEIRELSQAFNRMVEDLEHSRAHLVRATKLAAVGEMAAKLAHEVRTPLGIMRSSAQLMRRQDRLDEAGREMMSFMINECDRINALVTSLLETARPRMPDIQREDLNAIVRRALELVRGRAAERQVDVIFQPGRELPACACDRNQIMQVLLNLAVNAIQQVGSDGHVRISTARSGDGLELVIEDDGPGIPPERREAVFEPFVSFRAGGIGLGLPVVREIVAAHHGHIAIEDSTLGGARFVLSLPAAGGD